MDIAILAWKFQPAALKHINYCCMYLNVILVSDITDTSGTHIEDVYRGSYEDTGSHSLGHRVNQSKPNEKAWKIWWQFLHIIVNWDAQHTLKTPLGP